MSLYQKEYCISLGEPIMIVPNKTKLIYFIHCKNLPKGLDFKRDTGTIHGILEKEEDIVFIVKYIDRKINHTYYETIKISVKNAPITYSLHETNETSDENDIAITGTIKKSIDDLSSSNFMKYMHVNGANTFVYKI
jgi:hypothetical protein